MATVFCFTAPCGFAIYIKTKKCNPTPSILLSDGFKENTMKPRTDMKGHAKELSGRRVRPSNMQVSPIGLSMRINATPAEKLISSPFA
jgi:hypothetical protein